MSGFDLILELSSIATRPGENGDAITVLVAVDQFDGLVEGVDAADNHNWTENLLVIGGHAWFGVVNDGRTEPVSIW